MARLILIEEFHLSLKVPHALSSKSGKEARRILASQRFQKTLRVVVRAAIAQFDGLRDVRATLSR